MSRSCYKKGTGLLSAAEEFPSGRVGRVDGPAIETANTIAFVRSPRAAGSRYPITSLRLIVAAFLVGTQLISASAQDEQPPQNDAAADPIIVATVDGDPVYLSEIDRQVAKVVKQRKVEPEAMLVLQAQSLEQMVSRRLILHYLAQQQMAVSRQDIHLTVEQAKDRLGRQQLTLQEYLRRAGLTETEFHRAIEWQLGWQRYLDRYLTDENLQNYFKEHHKQFDGTQVQAAHILLKVSSADDQSSWDEAWQRAKQIRAEIASGKLDFAQAAKDYSQAPSGKNGGDIGLISRHEPMPEPFARAAFVLDKGDMSEPVISPFGVHLIKCIDIEPGQKRWHDVRKDLEAAVTRYLFDWVAGQQRPHAKIEFTGKSPHFKPGTKEVVE